MELYSLIGEHLPHSLSPMIHNPLMKSIDVNGTYFLMEVTRENLPDCIKAMKTLGIAGSNVTIPYKTMIMPYLDEITPEAKAIGAVNTINFLDGKAIGYNTDYFGFGTMLKIAGIDVKDKEVVQLGAGGAAKASLAFCHDAGAKSIRVVARRQEALDEMKAAFPYIETSLFTETDLIKGDVIINATPVGMFPNMDAMPIEKDIITRFSAAADLIYNPQDTKFIQAAKEAGMKAIGGLYMLLYQGIRAMEIWQDREIPQELCEPIYQSLCDHFKK